MISSGAKKYLEWKREDTPLNRILRETVAKNKAEIQKRTVKDIEKDTLRILKNW